MRSDGKTGNTLFMLENLKKYDIILASQSPRRFELLSQLCIPFKVEVKKDIDESYPPELPLMEIAPYLSQLKARAYNKESNSLIITADTVVICSDKLLGKPKDETDAKNMLRFLSGKTHKVVTGVTVASREKVETISVLTTVKFGRLSKEEIDFYVDKFKPLDKAGAYGIQEWIGGVAVEKINGSFYNVMGLPIHQLYRLLKKF